MNAITTNIDTLATQIKAEHLAVKVAAKDFIVHAMKCGDLLIEAKAKVRHGQWLPWLEKECDISERMSQHYMKLAQHRREVERKSEMISGLTLTEAIKLVGQKEDKRHATTPQLSKPKAVVYAAKPVATMKDVTPLASPPPPSLATTKEAATYAPTPALQSVIDVAATSTADDIKRDFETLKAAGEIVAKAAKLNAEKKNDTDAALADRQLKQEVHYLNELWALLASALELAHPAVADRFIRLIIESVAPKEAGLDLRTGSLEDIASMIVNCTGADRATDIARAILSASAPAAEVPAPAPSKERAVKKQAKAARATTEAATEAEAPAAVEAPAPAETPAPAPAAPVEKSPVQHRREVITRAYNLGLGELAKEVETDEKSYLTAERELNEHEAKMAAA